MDSPSQSFPLICCSQVEVKYSNLVYGLRDLNLNIQLGDFVFFVGKIGSGKSTLFKILTRELLPTKGTYYYKGKDIRNIKKSQIPYFRREIGIINQDFALLPKKRVWENIGYAMRATGMTRGEVRKKIPEILEVVHMAHRGDAYPHQLSGGEQQRVAIARALVNNPFLLIADEPTANLDTENSLQVMQLLNELNLKGTTVLVSTHDLNMMEKMSKKIVTIENGRIV